MPTIRKRESGQWQAVIRIKGWPEESKTFRTKKEALAWAQNAESEMKRGIYQSITEAERVTIKDLAYRFSVEYAPNHYRIREDGKEAWRYQLARIVEILGDYSIAALDQKLVSRYRDERLNPSLRSARGAVGESTVRKELYLLSKLLVFSESECGITLPRGNVVLKIRKPKESNHRERRLSDQEWAQLEFECRKSRNIWLAPALIFAVETAMRQGEMLSLEWKDIDRKRQIAMLSDPEKIKTHEPRAVPLSTRALKVLESLPKSMNKKIFPVERLTLYHAFISACKRVGIANYTWHDLRHESLSRLAERGDLSILELAAVSGHKTLQMLKRYTHLQAENLAKKLG